MSRAPQHARPNVPPPSVNLHHHHQQHQHQQHQHHQSAGERVPSHLQPQQQAVPATLAAHDDYYYEEVQEEEYLSDYAADEADECEDPQQMLHPHQQHQPATQPPPPHEIDPRRADVTELYRRQCGDIYPNHTVYHVPIVNTQTPQEYFYDPRVPQTQSQLRVMQPPIHAAPMVYRKRVVPVNATTSTSYLRVAPPLLQPQASQTCYLTSEEALALRHQQQQQQYEQYLHMQHQKNMQLQRQQNLLHFQQQKQMQHAQLSPQEVYRMPNVTNLSTRNIGTGRTGSMVRLESRPERHVQTNMAQFMDVNNSEVVKNSNINNNINKVTVASATMVDSDTRVQPRTKSSQHGVGATRRHPVTVRTPRYIRRAVNPNLFKRPSTLCLPLAVQPDPALYGATAVNPRRFKRNQHGNDVQVSPSPRSPGPVLPIRKVNNPQHSYNNTQPIMEGESSGGLMDNIHLTKPHSCQVGPAGHAPLEGTLPSDTQQRLDSIFQRYDRLFRTEASPSGDASVNLLERCEKGDPFENIDCFDKFENLAKLSKMEAGNFDKKFNMNQTVNTTDVFNLRPRTPPCLKHKQNDDTKVQPNLPVAETLQVEEMTTDMLDELLNELTEHGFSENLNEDQKSKLIDQEDQKQTNTDQEGEKYQRYLQEKEDNFKLEQDKITNELFKQSTNNEKNDKECPEKDIPKSFTYCEIKQCLSPSNDANKKEKDLLKPEHDLDSDAEKEKEKMCEREKKPELKRARKQESEGDISSKKSISSTTTTSATRPGARIIPRIMVDDAMELHRTKSYVVNLIDTALSNHFGTQVKDSTHKKDKLQAKSAMQMLKKQPSTTSSKASQKDLAEEIAHVLSENYGSNSRHSSISKGLSQCSCKSSSHEPMFVKQLRQMRWGHLKHIQQEVRRLEELERFLDSCNMSTFEKCHYH